MTDTKFYEFCGYLNTPDECAGGWFDDLPDVDEAGNPENRVRYYDRAAGAYYHNNWQLYAVEGLKGDTAQRITRFTITPVTVGEFRPGGISRPDVLKRVRVSWEKKIVPSFKTADGRTVRTVRPTLRRRMDSE